MRRGRLFMEPHSFLFKAVPVMTCGHNWEYEIRWFDEIKVKHLNEIEIIQGTCILPTTHARSTRGYAFLADV